LSLFDLQAELVSVSGRIVSTLYVLCLIGHIDADTREWTDGVLTAAARAVAKEPLEQRSWVVCDGDVDPEWIESLNSVLDDNRQFPYTFIC